MSTLRLSPLALLLGACAPTAEGQSATCLTLPDVSAAAFVSGVTNPYYPLPAGATWTHVATTDEGVETISVEVLAETRDINGVTATVVLDTSEVDGVLAEATTDWYAQDDEGNVWYLGEDTCEYEADVCVDTHGTWEWGVDGALPGIVMRADPAVDGVQYRQEYLVGEAEDYAEVIETGVALEVPAGAYTACVMTREMSAVDLTMFEQKTYCQDVGLALVENKGVSEELSSFAGL